MNLLLWGSGVLLYLTCGCVIAKLLVMDKTLPREDDLDMLVIGGVVIFWPLTLLYWLGRLVSGR